MKNKTIHQGKLNKIEKEIIKRNGKCSKCGHKNIRYECYGFGGADMVDFICNKCNYSWCDEYDK